MRVHLRHVRQVLDGGNESKKLENREWLRDIVPFVGTRMGMVRVLLLFVMSHGCNPQTGFRPHKYTNTTQKYHVQALLKTD